MSLDGKGIVAEVAAAHSIEISDDTSAVAAAQIRHGNDGTRANVGIAVKTSFGSNVTLGVGGGLTQCFTDHCRNKNPEPFAEANLHVDLDDKTYTEGSVAYSEGTTATAGIYRRTEIGNLPVDVGPQVSVSDQKGHEGTTVGIGVKLGF